jgi:hypothetical protein
MGWILSKKIHFRQDLQEHQDAKKCSRYLPLTKIAKIIPLLAKLDYFLTTKIGFDNNCPAALPLTSSR